MTKTYFLLRCSLIILFFVSQPMASRSPSAGQQPREVASSTYRFSYGPDPSQFGELHLPKGKGPFPVVVVIHGGCWYSEYDLNQLTSFNDRVTELGVATWSLEYRRIGNSGGGWPGTFTDVGSATDYLRVLAKSYPLDLKRVVVVGHSAGGQLALWLAARKRLPKSSPLYVPKPLALQGIVSLAGITDLRRYRPNCGDAVNKLMGGPPDKFPERYKETSPIELLPLRVDQWLIHGATDQIVPSDFARNFQAAAKKKGDRVRLTIIEGAGHFEVIAPQSSTWPAVEEAIRTLLRLRKK